MTLPGLDVFLFVIAIWAQTGDAGNPGLAGHVEAHAYASQGDCLEARDAAIKQEAEWGKEGIVAAYIGDCQEGTMTLLGDKSAKSN